MPKAPNRECWMLYPTHLSLCSPKILKNKQTKKKMHRGGQLSLPAPVFIQTCHLFLIDL